MEDWSRRTVCRISLTVIINAGSFSRSFFYCWKNLKKVPSCHRYWRDVQKLYVFCTMHCNIIM